MLTLINLLTSSIDLLILYCCASCFLKPKGKPWRTRLLWGAAISLGLTMASTVAIQTFSFLRVMLFFGVNILFVAMNYEGGVLRYTALGALHAIVSSGLEALFITVMDLAGRPLDVMSTTDQLMNLKLGLAFVATRLAYILIILLFKALSKRSMASKQWIGLAALSLLVSLFLVLVHSIYWPRNDRQINQLLVLFSVVQIIEIVFFVFYFMIIKSSLQQYHEIKEAYEVQRASFSMIKSVQRALSKIGHDIRHHLLYIASALEEEDIPKAKGYIINLDADLRELTPKTITGNSDFDVILFGKARIAARQSIHVEVQGTLPRDLEISAIDVSVLLGNAMDNAVEALCRCREQLRGAPEIRVQCGYQPGRLCVVVENEYAGKVVMDSNNNLKTSKKIGGLGVEIMRDVTEKYDGILLTDHADGVFRVTAYLCVPLKNEREQTETAMEGEPLKLQI